MPQNKEELKNKILYRASYRGTKEMDIMMTKFVKSIINNLNLTELNTKSFFSKIISLPLVLKLD